MSGKERRISPRKECALPLRFRVGLSAATPVPVTRVDAGEKGTATTTAARTIMDGQVVNLSERGLFFHSKQEVGVGTALDMFFTLPRELTGRSPEEVRCSARVVHVTPSVQAGEPTGMGVSVERFEPVVARRWYN
jgi:hypothetical protein